MKTLVIGGTGNVGAEVVKELLKNGSKPRVLTTSSEKATSLPAGVEGVVGNVDNEEDLMRAFKGVDRLFMVNAHTLTETEQAGKVVAFAKKTDIKKIVYQSIHRAEEFPEVPHIWSKVIIEQAIKKSGLPYTFVSPNNFFQNDFWYAEGIKTGIYSQPFGDVGLNRNDIRDIAEVAVIALNSSKLDGRTIPIVGPDSLTGEDTARMMTEILGYPVEYGGNDLVKWSEFARKMVPEWMVEDWKIMYQSFQKKGLLATKEDLDLISAVLGRSPRSYESFLKDSAPLFQRTPMPAL